MSPDKKENRKEERKRQNKKKDKYTETTKQYHMCNTKTSQSSDTVISM